MRIFIGREEALEALQGDLLGPSRYTIANLHGIGGVGKTTLKAEVLLRLQDAGAMIPVFHADENLARSDLAEFIGALADTFFQPWEGPTPELARVRRARHRLRELKGRLARERDGELLDRGLKAALSGIARRALLAKAPPDASPRAPEAIVSANVPIAMPYEARDDRAREGRKPALPGTPTAVRAAETVSTATPAGFTFQARTDAWSKGEQQEYERAVAAYTRDREDQELLLDPLGVLTRGLFDDLVDYLFPQSSGLLDILGAKRNLSQAPFRVLLAIDSYEALDPGLHDWLLAHVLPGTRRLHPDTGKRLEDLVDLRLLLCGREALRDADPLRRWDGHAGRIREIDLARFDAAEVGAYLDARGLPREEADRALVDTQGLPYLLALWCDSTGKHRALAVARAAKRVFWWKTPVQVRALKAAAYLDTLDRDGLAVLLADDFEAHEAYAWLSSNGEVASQAPSGGLALHPVVRSLVRAGLEQESPAEAAELERRGAIAAHAAALRAELGPNGYSRMAHLAPLRWFDADLLEKLFPAEAEALWALATRLAPAGVQSGGAPAPQETGLGNGDGPGNGSGDDVGNGNVRRHPLVEEVPDVPGALRVAEDPRRLLIDHARLAGAAAHHEAVAALREAARRSRDAEDARNAALARDAQSRAADASVARSRATASEAGAASLQADEQAAEDALKRAELAAPDPNRISRRAPWWAGSMSALLGAVASFGSLVMLGQGERLYGWSVGAALLVIALGCATRALWLPAPPSDAHMAAARRAIDDAAERLARVRAVLAQALLELSAAARLADQLQTEADQLAADSRQVTPAFV